MYDPVLSGSTSTSLTVAWTALTTDAYTGGSAITSYKLEWDKGTSTWETLVGDPVDLVSTSYTSSSLTAGTSYKYRLTAKNVYGWSSYTSAEVAFTPLGVPST